MFKKIPAEEIFSFSEVPPANLANPAKVQADPPETLATLAALAGLPFENAHFQPEIPSEWSEGYRSLNDGERPAKVSKRWWRIVQEDMYDFLQSDWALRALELGWDEHDLFGCHRESPEARFDAMGLILVMNRKRLVALSKDSARLEAQSGQGILKHNRGTCCPQQERVTVWDLAK